MVVRLHRSRFSCFCSDFKKWCRGDRSCASSVPIAHQSMAHSAASLGLPLIASSIGSMGDQAEVTLGLPRMVVALVPGVSGADDTS
jgi:hypothetical protein